MSGQYLGPLLEPILEEVSKAQLQVPRKYQVILCNDDYTPMDFVVFILRHFFYLSEEVAIEKMLAVHTSGQAVCGIYTKDIAETKVALVNEYARQHEHPLLCIMKPE